MINNYFTSQGRTDKQPVSLGKTTPSKFTPNPTEHDYNRGFLKRYFVQKRDRTQRIIEVSENQFRTLKVFGKGLNPKFYKGFVINWKITGPRHDIYNGKVPIRNGVEDTNRNLLELYEQDYPGITEYLDDPLEFWEERRDQ